MRTTVDIEKQLLDRLRQHALDEGVSFKELLNRVLRRGLEAPTGDAEPYRCPTFDMGQPQRGLDGALRLADALEGEEIARELSVRK